MRNKPIQSIKSVLGGLLMAALITTADIGQATSIATLGGGDPNVSPKYQGYRNGTTLTQALFRNPAGLAIDRTGNYLYVADRDNNAVRLIDFSLNYTGTLLTMTNYVPTTNLLKKPVGVALDLSYNLFVLNKASNTNGYVLQFDSDGELIATNLSKITNAAAIAVDNKTNIYVTASNKVFKVAVNTGISSLVTTISNAGCSLQGIVVKRNGQLAVCDAGRNGILFINPANGAVTTNAGFHGKGDFVTVNNYAISNTATFFQPYGIAETGDGTLIVSDFGNHRIKAVLTTGIVSNICSVSSNNWGGTYPGWFDHSVVLPESSSTLNAQSRQPNGIAYAYDGSIYVSEDFYHTIRKITGSGLALLPPPPVPPPSAPINLSATTNSGVINLSWTAVGTATNYNVKRSPSSGGPYTIIGTTTTTSFTDTNVVGGATYYYVVSAINASGESPDSTEVSATLALPPVPTPQIGFVDYPATQTPIPYTSRFNPVATSLVLNNDAQIVIVGAFGSQTFFTYGVPVTNSFGVFTNPPNPTTNSASAPSGYSDGLSFSQVVPYTILQAQPNVLVKAIGTKNDGSPNSAVASARFQFITANPLTSGANAAAFTITDITQGAHLYYTTDGTDPDPNNVTNPPVDLGTVPNSTNGWNISLAIQADTLFKVRAFKANYQPSAVVITLFTLANYAPNTISFGFANGEASSSFIASPGQYFYAPVTLSLVGVPTIYSLQFNLVVTNGGTNPAPSPITSYGFSSMLVKPVLNTFSNLNGPLYTIIPPMMFAGGGTFTNGIFNNTNASLLGVGWLERAGQTNLFLTGSQDLITYSQAHDTLFAKSGGKIIVGGYSILIPSNAPLSSTYQIQLGRPSATSDGIGANGSSVNISALTNGGFGPGSLNAVKYVTIGQYKYIAGDVYPFRWFNAGDFGSSNLVSADVAQVFQTAIYNLNSPPYDPNSFNGVGFTNVSDFYDAMDSCGNIGALDGNSGYYTNSQTSYLANYGTTGPLFDGNDTTINQVAFGDGNLDVCDVYVTFRRSLDPSLTWFHRFWSNGARVADITQNVTAHTLTKLSANQSVTITPKVASISTPPQVNLTAGDVIGSAGQTISIPISATVLGNYPLRVLMLNLTVVPLDGSPPLTTQVTFNQTASMLGATYGSPISNGNGNIGMVWLNSTNAGITGTATIGNLNVTIPATAGPKAAYAIHFDHASASPNGLASFHDQTLTGVLTTTTRTNSSYGDGIPDSWRLRWFGTTNNVLTASNACPSGDGVSNWNKFIAGVDPGSANNFPKLNPKSAVTAGYTASIHWPTVLGKKYAIERSATLFNGSWSILTTNTGTGGDMGYDDTTTNKVKFYRVRILP